MFVERTTMWRSNSTTELFISRMKELILEDPQTTFFLATVSKLEKQKFVKIFGNRIIVNDIIEYGCDSSKGIVSRTKKILGSYHSTFSQIAADIGRIELEEVS